MTELYRKNGQGSRKLRSLAEQAAGLQRYRAVLLCAVSLKMVADNIHMASLPLIVLQLAKDKREEYLCGALAVAYYISTFTQTAFYVPCTAFVMVYLASQHIAPHGVKAAYPAALSYGAAKLYLLSYGYDPVYYLVFALETAALLFLPDTVAEGLELAGSRQLYSSPWQLVCILFALVFICLVWGGIGFFGVGIAPALLLAFAMLSAEGENTTSALLAIPALLLLLWGNRYYMPLAVGYTVIFTGAMLFSQRRAKALCTVMAMSVVVALLFIEQSESIVFVWQTALGLLLFLCAQKGRSAKTVDSHLQYIADDESYIKKRIERLDSSFRFLGHSVIDISQLIKQESPPEPAEDIAAEEVCRRCRGNTFCWQHNYSETQKQLSSYVHSLKNGGKAEFSPWFYSTCHNTAQLADSLERANALTVTQRLMDSAGAENRAILQRQFLAMADILQEITHHSSGTGAANTAFTHAMDRFLRAIGKKTRYCICYQNPGRCIISTSDSFREEEMLTVRAKLERLYSCSFSLPSQELEQESIVYTFSQQTKFCGDFYTQSSSRYSHCGDVCIHFTAEEYSYIILADGMGTGSFARAEATTAAELLKSLLSAGVMVNTAIETVNTAFNLKGCGQSCVALEVFRADLNSGSCTICKAGGAASVLFTGNKAQLLYRDSLPIGVLKDIKTAQFDFTMANGDTLVLMSDGVEGQDSIGEGLRLVREEGDGERLCGYILNHNASQDDATVASFTLTRV